MIIATIVIIPFTYQYAKFIRFIVPSKKTPPEPSYLDYQVMEYPERAIVAVIRELQRISRVCAHSLYLTTHVVLGKFDRNTVLKIKTNEQVVDDIKIATREYLANMTKKYLSRRQIIMSHHLNKCITDIERVGDHIDELCDLSLKSPKSELDKESLEGLFALHQKSQRVLALVIKSLTPENENFQESALAVLNARDEYIECSIDINQKFIQKVEKHDVSSLAALYYKEYISVMDRMIRHIESIAFAQKHEDFWIKRSKLDKKPDKVEKTNIYNVDTTDYIDKLQAQDYL
jgi:phosphate:Na+ symporter